MLKFLKWIITGACALCVLTQTTAARTNDTIVARVLSVNPFIVEFLQPSGSVGRSFNGSVTSITEITRIVPGDVEGLRFGDIFSARTCWRISGECDGAIRNVIGIISDDDTAGMGINKELRELTKLDRSASKKYEGAGLLFVYASNRNNEIWQPQMLIDRSGTVLLKNLYAGEISNQQLSKSELNRLVREYKSTGLDRITPDATNTHYYSGFVSTVSKFQTLNIEKPSVKVKRFQRRLDALIDNFLHKATYRITYTSRTQIKDWQYGDILPLDQVDETALQKTGIYWRDNTERLSKLKPSPAFYEEAVYQSGKFNSFLYRYKNELYVFQFAQCSSKPTGTWACSQTWKLKRGTIHDKPKPAYVEWPQDLQVKLRDIPTEGLDVPIAEIDRHRDFYNLLLGGNSGFAYQEGDYSYAVKLMYR